jgi:hypothetical protein
MARLLVTARGHIEYRGKRYTPPPPEELRGHRYYDLELAEAAVVAAEAGANMMALTYLTTAVATAMINTMTATGLFMGINSGNPANTGANEIAPGTGYTGNRQAVTWAAFATDHQTSSNTQTFPLLAVQAGGIPYFSIWTAATAGTVLTAGPTSGLTGSIPNGANVVFTNGITLTVAG